MTTYHNAHRTRIDTSISKNMFLAGFPIRTCASFPTPEILGINSSRPENDGNPYFMGNKNTPTDLGL